VLDVLLGLAARLGDWAYVLIFAGAALESAAFLGLIVPGEGLVLAAGFFAAIGVLDLGILVPVVAAGAAIGDSIGYELGRRLGRDWLARRGRWAGLRRRHLERVDRFFARHGGKAVFFGRFVGLVRALAPFLAGASRMPYPTFLRYNVLGAVLWAAATVLLGYAAGASWQVVDRWLGRATGVILGVAAAAAVFLARRARRAAARREAERAAGAQAAARGIMAAPPAPPCPRHPRRPE